MLKRFLFINPPYERLKGLTLQSMPLGLLYLATVLKDNGYEVKVYDADSEFKPGDIDYTNINRAKRQQDYAYNLGNEQHPAWIELREVLSEYHPDFVGITMMTPIFSSCQKVMQIVRQILPDAVILIGGPHVTILKEKALKSAPAADVGFVGEAEESILEFARSFPAGLDWTKTRGILYRKDESVIFTGPRNRIAELDNLPIPDRNLLHNHSRYKRAKLGLMIASRGCPFDCAFCASVPLWERKVRMRSPGNLAKEIDYLVDNYNISSFGFWDDTFTMDKKAVIEFCQILYKRYGPRRFKWNCLTNVNCVDIELLSWLKKAGCRVIEIGVESGSDRILKLIKKRITTEQVRSVSSMIKKNGFWLHTFFMVGLPYETEDDIRKTINFIKEIKPDSMNLCTFTPHPGTQLYDYVVSRGIFEVDDNYSVYDFIGHHSVNNFFLEAITQDRYKLLLHEILELSTKVSRQLTPRKFLLKLRRLTLEKVKHRIRYILKPVKYG